MELVNGFFIIPYITYMKWKIKLMFETTNQWRIGRMWRNVEKQAVSEARLWLAWIRKLQCSPVSLHFFAWCRTWFRFSYSASLPKFWNELEKNIEKSSQFFWEQLYHSLSSVIRSSSTSRFIHASFTLRCLRVLGHVPFDQFDQSKENSTESITDLIRVRHIQTRFRRKWEKQASNAEEF